MALDRVPWFVSTEGAQHSSESARVLGWAATGGAAGVVGASSFRVTEADVPDGSVRVAPGVAAIPSNYAGGDGQSYIARAPTVTSRSVTATGSAGGRSDAVILRIDDPGSGVDPASHEFVRVEIVEGVSSSLSRVEDLGLDYPAVLLARVNLPASTGTVEDSMITDLRETVMGRTKTVGRSYGQLSSDDLQYLTSQVAYPQGEYFPRIGGDVGSGAVHTVRVPDWATRMRIRAEWLSVAAMESSGNGHMWVAWDTRVQNDPAWFTQAFRWSSGSFSHRQNWVVADDVRVDPSIRGSEVMFSLRANRDQGNSAGEIRMDIPSGIVLEVEFREEAD